MPPPQYCKYYLKCSKKGCTDKHTQSPISCRSEPNCTTATCLFLHPSQGQQVTEACFFDPKCTNKGCLWLHPSRNGVANMSPSQPVYAGISASVSAGASADADSTPPSTPQRVQTHSRHSTSSLRSQAAAIESTSASPASASTSTRIRPVTPPASPDAADWCEDGEDCEDFDCECRHPSIRPKKCRFGAKCFDGDCRFLHPESRIVCADSCMDYDCKLAHSRTMRLRRCKADCVDADCQLLHPSNRTVPCVLGIECKDAECDQPHPAGRSQACHRGDNCWDAECTFLHSRMWYPCPDGLDCENRSLCKAKHPPPATFSLMDCIKVLPMQTLAQPASTSPPPPSNLRTIAARQAERDRVQLPILKSRDVFLQRLASERFLIVTAETGSGKTTQLPQYAAECERLVRAGGRTTQGLVVCTQPRAMAASTIARRVADEYDGPNIGLGSSVGCKVGNAATQRGSQIMYMTDAALIRELRDAPSLNHISVLIIDEAHERTLNTDIVLGIARQILTARKDFFVVVASATIDPRPFIEFFRSATGSGRPPTPLSVEGRVYPVSLEYLPPNPLSLPRDDFNRFIADHVVPTTVTTLGEHSEGHALVFLPGQSEIERAIRLFQNTVDDDTFVALPLYGSLSSDEQTLVMEFDQKNPTKRMVVFTTNVAETSLTVPGVKIVIDSGWAKEARFDAKRRITVLELVRISASSANQRKGRAGRLSTGHCVRLFAEDELTRPNIEPEIHRASLDGVILQLYRSALDPQCFPFMDAPDRDLLLQSIALLTRLGCLQADPSPKLTAKGDLISDLPFDPRYSALVLYLQERGYNLANALAIAAIQSAPGSVFYMGNKQERKERQKKIAEDASAFQSDLLFHSTVFERWQAAGASLSGGRCTACNRNLGRFNGCKPCRAKHARENDLNNKVLEFVLQTVATCERTISRSSGRRQHSSDRGRQAAVVTTGTTLASSTDKLALLGEALCHVFPDALACALLRNVPSEGLCVVSSKVRARIQNTSVVLNQASTVQSGKPVAFIALGVTHLPNGEYVIEKLHPILSPLAGQGCWETIVAFSKNNIGPDIASQVRLKIRELLQPSNPTPPEWAKWAVVHHNGPSQLLSLRTHPVHARAGKAEFGKIVEECLRVALEYETEQYSGACLLSLKSGGAVCRAEKAGTECRLELPGNWKTVKELEEWLQSVAPSFPKPKWKNLILNRQCDDSNCTSGSISQSKAASSSRVQLIFNSVTDASLARQILAPHLKASSNSDVANIVDDADGSGDVSISVSNLAARGKSLQLFIPAASVSVEAVRRSIESDFNVRLALDPVVRSVREAKLRIRDWFPSVPIEEVTAFLAKNGIKVTVKRVPPRADGNMSNDGQLDVWYADADRSRIESLLNDSLFQAHPTFSKTFLDSKAGKQRTKEVRPSLAPSDSQASKTLTILDVVFESSQQADAVFAQATSTVPGKRFLQLGGSTVQADCFEDVFISKASLFSDIEDMAKRAVERADCPSLTVSFAQKPKDVKVAKFTGGPPSKVAHAAQLLRSVVSSSRISCRPAMQFAFYNELFETNVLRTLASKHGIDCNFEKKSCKIVMTGPHSQQSQFVLALGEIFDRFSCRYELLHLGSVANSAFRTNHALKKQLSELNRSLRTCRINYIPREQAIEIIAPDETQRIGAAKQVERMFDGLKLNLTSQACSSCDRGRVVLMLTKSCGHGFCNDCQQSVIQRSCTDGLAACPCCTTPIHCQQLRQLIGPEKWTFFLRRVFQVGIQSKQAELCGLSLCVNSGCKALLDRIGVYQVCPECQEGQCVVCNTTDPSHASLSCAEFAARLKELERWKREWDSFHKFVEMGQQFVKDNWPVDMPAVARKYSRVDVNPALCTNSPSWLRFMAALKSLKLEDPAALATSFQNKQAHFGWHGTSDAAVPSIALNGFDPNRRAGQVYGPGEYFGQSATTSLGYCKGGSRMFLSLLVHGPCNHSGTFAYVVDNPKDWRMSFCFPLLVVSWVDTPVPFLSAPATAPILSAGAASSRWVAPFRWHWRHDDGTMRPYADDINRVIENGYDLFVRDRSQFVFTTPAIVRYVDDRPQVYQINYVDNKQINVSTRYPREICRRTVELTTSRNWFFLSDMNVWQRYDDLTQDQIEKAFQVYVSGRGPSIISMQFPGRPEEYELDFCQGTQTNLTSETTRKIERR